MPIEPTCDGFAFSLGGSRIFHHSARAPCFFVGRGDPSVKMRNGYYDVEDFLAERMALSHAEVSPDGLRLELARERGSRPLLRIAIEEQDGKAALALTPLAGDLNRFWLRAPAMPGECVWGAGEQFSYFNLAGRRFPIWVREPGVGRDRTTQITFLADRDWGAGGDYGYTYYPQPTFISSRRYALHVDTTAYAVLDFRRPAFHEIEVWSIPARIELFARSTFLQLVEALVRQLGLPLTPPEWVHDGAIIGLKSGQEGFARLESVLAADTRVAAMWSEDWSGIRITSLGRRLFWNFRWSPERYPDLPERMRALAARGVRFLGYVNPQLCRDGSFFREAQARGYLVRNADDAPYLIDFGEFEGGLVDFTNPEAAAWYADEVIGRNMIDFGLAGWMADFGEFLPADARLSSGEDPLLAHNRWPLLWGAVNARAVASRGREGEILYFMRAGYTGMQRHSPLLWAGDQCVDFSRHDGIGTAVCAALSAGLTGNAFHHSDIGGFHSVFGLRRSPELMQRWAELAAFTAAMRTHEGNRPDENLQVDDPKVLPHFARMTRLFAALKPYRLELAAEAAERGTPLQRPLFLHYDDPATYAIQDEFLLGPDLLVAPVITDGVRDRDVYLPGAHGWIHLWSGRRFEGGRTHTIAAPIDQPAVLYREGSPWRPLFESLGRL